MKNVALILSSVLILLTGAAHAAAGMVNGERLTAAEILSLDPVCRLIMIEVPHGHIDYIAQKRNAALFDRPGYQMAKNAIHVHHRCWATVSRYRYFNTRSSQKKQEYLTNFHADMDYVIRNMQADWAYMPLMHVEKGDMYFWTKQYVEAIAEANLALAQNPAFVRAYSLLIDAYNGLGQKAEALAAATEGLKHNPESSTLKRLYEEAGGKPPYPKPYAKGPEAAAEPPVADATASAQVAPAQAVPVEPATPGDTVAPESAPKSNPYCRFCP